MHYLAQSRWELQGEARLLWAALRDRRLWLALGLFAALLLLAAQAPLRYSIAVGTEEGYGSDRPIIAGFYDPETSPSSGSSFRWTTGQSFIRLPGLGQRAIQLRLRLLPVNQELAQRGPREVEAWAGGQLIGRLPIRPTSGGSYRLLVPPPADGSGDQLIELRSATINPTGDARAIGTAVDGILVEAGAGPTLPAWRSTLAWLGAALLGWLALRRAGIAPNAALGGLLAALLLASLAALLDPPRSAFGASVALVALGLGWLLVLLLNAAPEAMLLAGAALALPAALLYALVGSAGYAGWGGPGAVALGSAVALLLAGWLRPALGALYRRAAEPIPPPAWRWLVLFALLVLTTRYGGKIYPDSMWGDIGFHTNRSIEVLQGRVLLLSRNRGVDFPYPPAFYLALMPFGLLGLDVQVLLRLGGALLDAASPFLVYTIAARVFGSSARAQRIGLVAAGIYSFSASGFMTTWWNFSTHIYSQFVHLLLITVLMLLWPVENRRTAEPQNRRTASREPQNTTPTPHPPPRLARLTLFVALFVLQSLLYLGHFGFWMNMSLLGGFGLAVLLLATIFRRGPWSPFWLLLGTFVAAELFATLFYYAAYTGLFIQQAQVTIAGGLTQLADRGPTDRALLWQNLWDSGFRIHFGFFPVPLALCGLVLPWGAGARGARRGALITLMLGTFLIALLFGSLPFITGSTLSTRWLMFSAWAIAVGAAVVADVLWRSGRAGRWLLWAMGGYMVWVTASMWLGALAWRIRPPEPF